MARRSIKGIAARQSAVAQHEWSDRWLDLPAIRSMTVRFGRDVLEWGWLAGLLGSALWVLFLFLGSDFSIADDIRAYLLRLDLSPFPIPLCTISLLLFLHSTLSLLLVPVPALPRSARFGLITVCVGLLLSALGTADVYVLDAGTLVQIFQDNSQNSQFGGILNILGVDGPYFAQLGWFSHASLGLVIVSVGLVILYVALTKTKMIPVWLGMAMTLSAVVFHIPKLLLDSGLIGPDLEYFLFEQNVFTILLVLFGANWAWMGAILIRKQRQTQGLILPVPY